MNRPVPDRMRHAELGIGFLAGIALSSAVVALVYGERLPALILISYPIAVAYLELRRVIDVEGGWRRILHR